MKALEFMLDLHKVCHFQTKEGKRVGLASNGEIRRWIQARAVLFNNEPVDLFEEIDFPIFSLVLFPRAESRITLFSIPIMQMCDTAELDIANQSCYNVSNE